MGKGKRDAEILSGISVAPSVSCRMQISQYVLSVEKNNQNNIGEKEVSAFFFFSVLLPVIFLMALVCKGKKNTYRRRPSKQNCISKFLYVKKEHSLLPENST